MEFGERLLLALAIVGVVMLISLFWRPDPKKQRAEIVRSLLTESRLNFILVDTFDRQPKPRRFETTCWRINRKRAAFLDKELRQSLEDSFALAEDYNQRLKAAKKARKAEMSNQSAAAVAKREPFDCETMRGHLEKITDGLEDWLLANVGTIDDVEKPSMFGGLFGR